MHKACYCIVLLFLSLFFTSPVGAEEGTITYSGTSGGHVNGSVAVSSTDPYVCMLAAEQYVSSGFEPSGTNGTISLIGMMEREDLPFMFQYKYEYSSNGHKIPVYVFVDAESNSVNDKLSCPVSHLGEIAISSIDAVAIAQVGGIEGVYHANIEYHFDLQRIVWRVWGYGVSEGCTVCTDEREWIERGALIDAQNGDILLEFTNTFADPPQVHLSSEERIVPKDVLTQERSLDGDSSIIISSISYPMGREKYIGELQQLSCTMYNGSSETRKLYQKITVYYADGTTVSGESEQYYLESGASYTIWWEIPSVGKGIGFHDVEVELCEGITFWPDKTHDTESTFYWMLFEQPAVDACYFATDTWHHPLDSNIYGQALVWASGAKTPQEAATLLMQSVYAYMDYDLEYTERVTDISLLYFNKGVCISFADLYIGLARSINVPTRTTRGTLYSFEGDSLGTYCGLYCIYPCGEGVMRGQNLIIMHRFIMLIQHGIILIIPLHT